MNFDIEFFGKLNPGGLLVSYADQLTDCEVEDLSWLNIGLGSKFRGYLEIEGKRRLVQGGVGGERIVELELTEIGRGDTFMNVTLGGTPMLFQERLGKIGVPSVVIEERLELLELPITFYYEDGKLVSIVWTELHGEVI